MNKFIVSAGLAAISAAALENAVADDTTSPKYWSVGATLRGFYDDNYNIGPSSKGSFGTEVLPTVSTHLPMGQTDIGIRYTYGLYYYENRDEIGVDAFDQTHDVDLWLDHAFNERWHTHFSDSFVVGQEPELLNTGAPGGGAAAQANPYRVNGDNLANHGTIELDTEWTRLFSTALTYNNGYYQYQNSGAYPNPNVPGGVVTPSPINTSGTNVYVNGPSLAGLDDRDEESIGLDLKWAVLPETVAFLGYSLGWVNYTGNEALTEATVTKSPVYPLGYIPDPHNTKSPFLYHSADRDNVSHTVYVGASENFTPNLAATVRGGIQVVDAYADPLFPTTSVEPYADVSLTYTYLPGSYLQFGYTQSEGASDQVAPDGSGHITDYTENSVVYLNVNHQFTEKLTASFIGRVQYSTYNAGAAANADTTDYGLGLNVTYQINLHLSVDAGYNYDDVESDISGYGYSRNRVYLGLTATY